MNSAEMSRIEKDYERRYAERAKVREEIFRTAESEEGALALASAPDLPRANIDACVRHENPMVREALAKNPALWSHWCGNASLNLLSRDPSLEVRLAVAAANPLMEMTQRQLNVSQDDVVRCVLAQNPSLHPDLSNSFSTGLTSFRVMLAWLAGPHLPPRRAEKHMDHRDFRIRRAIWSSPVCPAHVREVLDMEFGGEQ